MRACIDCGAGLSVNPRAQRCKPCAGRYRRAPEVACSVCGEAFYRARRSRKVLTCSNECRLIALNRLPKWNQGHRTPRVTSRGYVRVWDGSRLVMAHRLVMEQKLGRKLLRGERVHHVNRDKADNRPENLRLYASHSDHIRTEHPELAQNLR